MERREEQEAREEEEAEAEAEGFHERLQKDIGPFSTHLGFYPSLD